MLFHMSSKPCISLWNQFLEGDNDAFAEIYKLTVKDLFQYGTQFTDDRDTIKDCIHDIFVKLYTNRDNLKPIDNLMGYLSIALRNSILNTLKIKRSIPYDETDDERCDDETPETSFLFHERKSIGDKIQYHSIRNRTIATSSIGRGTGTNRAKNIKSYLATQPNVLCQSRERSSGKHRHLSLYLVGKWDILFRQRKPK